jgi:predicted transposase YbfD/YdcC
MKETCDKEHVNNWIRVVRFYHNHIRVWRDKRPEYLRFIQTITEALT